jgi:four helix bundle protein
MRSKEEKRAFANQLEKRTKDFTVLVFKSLSTFSRSDESRILKNQLIRSIASIGANYREANRARSQADFRIKIKISEAEASEALYWVEILEEMNWLEENKLREMKSELKELLSIFSSIVGSLNRQR